MRGLGLSILIAATVLSSCIGPYEHENANTVKSIVVDALITDEKEDHKIIISQSTILSAPVWDPVSNANVVVIDKGGNIFEFDESNSKKGVYEGKIDREYLVAGNAFKISFTTHEGLEYESAFEDMLACSEVDSIYYEVNNEYYRAEGQGMERGVEFFLDVKADENFSSYYRWHIEEAYEYHATWPIERFWRAEWWHIEPDYKYFTCYKSEPIFAIFSGTTAHLNENVYMKQPLNFVNNKSQKLFYRYSILVKQMSISDKAHYYWEGLKDNNQTAGGLYNSQPVKVIGNVVCLSNPEEVVLGYFGVSSVKTKRISMIKADFNGLIYDQDPFCLQQKIEPENSDFIVESDRSIWPIYLAPPPFGEPEAIYYANQACFDCRLAGGTLDMPNYWD